MVESRRRAPLDDALDQLERRRRDRWIVFAVLLVAVLAALGLLLVTDPPPETAPWVAVAFLLVAVVYGGTVLVEERRARRLTRTLIAGRERAAAQASRISALESLQHAARDLTAADELPDVFERLIETARRLTGARSGAVLLRVRDALTVAGSAGPSSPPRGTRLPRNEGPVWTAVLREEPVQSGRGAPWGGAVGSSTIAAPLRLPDRTVGALVVERDPDARAFTETDVAIVALFAQHAALALRNATRLDDERVRVAELHRILDEREAHVAGILHDLRAPLAAVAGFLQVLRDRDERLSPERRRSMLDDVNRELNHLDELIDGLVQVHVSDAHASEQVVVDLADLARDLARTGRGLGYEQGRSRQVEVRATRSSPVVGDERALRRAITNLVENAAEHTPPGTPIELEVDGDEQWSWLTVRDHGPGLDPAVAELAFEPFAHRPGGGTGLGLFIARRLISAHGGEVTLRPAPGGGTVAEVVLPRTTTP